MSTQSKPSLLSMVFAVLDARSLRNLVILFFSILVSSVLSVGMVLSVFPFLTFLISGTEASTPMVGVFRWVFGEGVDLILVSGLFALGVTLLSLLADVSRIYFSSRFLARRTAGFSSVLMARALARSHAERQNQSVQTEKQILVEAGAVSAEFLHSFLLFSNAFLVIVGLLLSLLWVEPVFTLGVMAVFGSLYVCVHVVLQRFFRVAALRRREAEERRFRSTREAILGAREIQMLGRQRVFHERFQRAAQDFAENSSKFLFFSSVTGVVFQGFFFLSVLSLILILVQMDSGSDATFVSWLPTLALFAFAGKRLMPEINTMITSLSTFTYVRPIVEDYIRKASLGMPDFSPVSPLVWKEAVSFEGVTFSHPSSGRSTPSLSEVTLRIGKGERVGVVGATGSGKTTLTEVLMGLWTPDEGSLCVDGVVVDDSLRASWQRAVAFVPQDLFLVDGTVADNITLLQSRQERDPVRLAQALEWACLDKEVADLPMGVDTPLGERGHRFSGGQKQRLGLARALYTSASVLILDEATSALDTVTEQRFLDALSQLPKDLTVVIVAHRLSTLSLCDKIVVMDQGRVEDVGTWAEMSDRSQRFQALLSANAVG